MNLDELESRLRQIPLGGPDPEVKRRLLREAASRMRARQRGGVLRWAFGTAAALLIIINLSFGQIHTRRIQALTGRPAIQRVASGAAYAECLEFRAEMLGEILGSDSNS